MKLRTSHRFLPQLEALEARLTPSSRPISDFLSAQGTTSLFPNGINAGGPAGLPDELGWATSTATVNNGTARFARVDYTGQDVAFLGLNLGTTTSGTISERVLADGTAEDTVILHTHNAFAWANNFDGITNPVAFGYLPSQLAADPSLSPPLADSTLQVVVRLPHPGAALPDLVTAPASAIVSESFRATATGTTPTGQQATLVVSETGVLGRTPSPIRDAGFTAEVVDIQTHGNAPAAVASPAAGPAVSAAAPTAHHGNDNPGILPVNSHAFGASYSQWSARWWQYAYSVPAAQNPFLDTTGANFAVGQTGKVWFLSGTAVITSPGGPLVGPRAVVTRDVTMPAGKALFFPILNTEFDNLNPGNPDTTYTADQLRTFAKMTMDAAENLELQIDGKEVLNL
jgi:hypothetical protein